MQQTASASLNLESNDYPLVACTPYLACLYSFAAWVATGQRKTLPFISGLFGVFFCNSFSSPGCLFTYLHQFYQL